MGWLSLYHRLRLRREDLEIGPIISKSGLFDREYYLKTNTDVAEKGLDPLRHYIRQGRHEGRTPCDRFDPRAYAALYPDVRQSGLDPLVHFIRYGSQEGRRSRSERQIISNSGLFDADYYSAAHLDVAVGEVDPFRHYLFVGRQENRRPSLAFDPLVYLAHSPDIKSGKLDPILHYIEFGKAENRICRRRGMSREELSDALAQIRASGLFDDDFYVRQCPALKRAKVDPLLHYVLGGLSHFFDPSPHFSTRAYKQAHPEINGSRWNPLLHFLGYTEDENIGTSSEFHRLPTDAVDDERRVGEAYFLSYRFSFDSVESPGVGSADAVADLALRSPGFIRKGDDPDVSIIIPVYGQLQFVLGCLDSLSRQSSQFSAEIIIADDNSPETAETGRLQEIPWVRYRRNAANLGFLDNCNETAKTAHGRFLIFLNSDTRVTEGWLNELVGSFTLFPKAGLIGSSFINRDGTLQESGAILWRDGSAWNYGRDDDPNHPRYCFARQADYVSGAAIAVPADVWRQMGGFDIAFRPAYCEDADLAFRLRAAGYEVWVQPLARVLHYEGKTHGRDLTKGVKKHQTINTRTMAERWRDTLSEHRRNGYKPDDEANRTVQNRLFVLDASTPRPDQDSGSFITVRMLKALQVLGYHVTFVPQHNYHYDPAYTAALQRSGIECVYRPYFQKVSDILDFRNDFDAVLAYRFNVLTEVYEEIRKRMPTARILFHNVDLHYLRKEREAALYGSRTKKIAAAITKAAELELIAKVDCTIVHTGVEKDIIQQQLPVENIVEFPYIAELHPTAVEFADRHDVLFLGGFDHPPNADAVKHFVATVWPVLVRSLPEDACFLIVGPHAGADIRALASARVIVTGYVKDLQPYFDRARVFVAPLRYGAGIKGKVIQSLCHGAPAVISAVAAEGIKLVSGQEALIAENDDQLVEGVLKLYSDRVTWKSIQAAGYRFVQDHFSWQRCLDLTALVLDTADAHWLARHNHNLQSRLENAIGVPKLVPGGATPPLLKKQNAPWVEPGHFYSPLVDPRNVHVAATLDKFQKMELPPHSAISLDQQKMTAFFSHISTRYDQLPFVPYQQAPLHYYYENPYFSYGDAITLGLMLLEFQPRRIVEVGSGFSSAAMIDVNEQVFAGEMEMAFVEPYPDRLLGLLPQNSRYRQNICQRPVQALTHDHFRQLEKNDILFIDSSHVSKMASDLNHLMFNVLPLLKPGVLIHLHDIFYPFEYPPSWIVEENRSWNEAYLVRAFLEFNNDFEVLFFNHFAFRKFPNLMAQKTPLFSKNCGGSLWLRRT